MMRTATATGRWVREGNTVSLLGAFGGGGGNGNGAQREVEAPRPWRQRRRRRLQAQELELESQPMLRVGSRGGDVVRLQQQLAALGFSPGPTDGIFGAQTSAAVRAFQSSHHLTVDGIVGPQTWGALDGAAAPAPPSPPRSAPGATYPRASKGPIQLQVPFCGYQSNDRDGCFRRCTEMAAAVGVTVGGPDVRIQVALREDGSGHVTVDPDRAREGLAYIDAQLQAGHPVVVGVSYMDADYNVDDITDHFVIITARGVEPDGDLYYAFHDPATSHASSGTDASPWNRFYPGADGALFRPAASQAPLGSHTYDVAMVRRNV